MTKIHEVSRRRLMMGIGAGATVAAAGRVWPAGAQAAAFPSQDVHFISGSAAGSGADVIVRYFAEKMKPLLGRNVIVENRVGALGNIAAGYVARAKPDGHTLFITGANGLAANIHMLNGQTNGPDTLQIVATINRATMMIAVRANSPITSIPELTAAMKAKGEKASYAFTNPTSKVLGAMYRERAGLKAVEVPYRAGADFLNDLDNGTLDYAVPDNILAMAQARQGRMRLLAVGAAERMEAAPDIPALAEFGYSVDIRSWWAALVPIATPRPVVERLNALFNQVVGSAETKAFLNSIASDPWVTTPDEAQAYLRRQVDDWGDYVRIARIEKQ